MRYDLSELRLIFFTVGRVHQVQEVVSDARVLRIREEWEWDEFHQAHPRVEIPEDVQLQQYQIGQAVVVHHLNHPNRLEDFQLPSFLRKHYFMIPLFWAYQLPTEFVASTHFACLTLFFIVY